MPKTNSTKQVIWHFGKQFSIPENWKIAPFGDGIKFLTDHEANGSYAKLAEFAKVGIGKPYAWFVRSVDLEKNRIGLVNGNQFVNEDSYDFLKKTKLFGGELLLMKVGSIGNIYLLPKLSEPATLGNNLYLIFTNEKLDAKFTYYWFKSILGLASLFRIASSTTLPSINKDNTKSCLIFYPSISEQQKIASILTNVDLLIQQYEKSINSTKLLRYGLMQQLLTKGICHNKFKKVKFGKIPESWVITKLKDICTKITDGTHFSPPNHDQGDFLYLTSKNLRHHGIDLSNISFVSKEIHDEIFERCNPEKNDVLFVKDGAGTGLAVVNTLDYPFSMLSSVALLKPDNSKIHFQFLNYFLNYKPTFQRITGEMVGSAIRRVTLEILQNIDIILPSLQEQQKIIDILSKIDIQINDFETKKKSLDSLKKGLMQKLLTGKIRVKV